MTLSYTCSFSVNKLAKNEKKSNQISSTSYYLWSSEGTALVAFRTRSYTNFNVNDFNQKLSTTLFLHEPTEKFRHGFLINQN